eukprot:604519-Amphidinium_carterae.1
MLSLPKQTSHKRDLPNTFEGNRQTDQQGAPTTFKNWAAEVQIKGSQLGGHHERHEGYEDGH